MNGFKCVLIVRKKKKGSAETLPNALNADYGFELIHTPWWTTRVGESSVEYSLIR